MQPAPRNDDGDVAPFGLDAADDAWLHHLRDAEAPLQFGRSGPYELLEELGRGGQGVVYRARHATSGRPVAVKRLLGGALATAQMRRRFEREIEALGLLDHPSIVSAFAADVVDGAPVLAMEWIDGAPITQWAVRPDGSRQGARESVQMILRVCEAVQHAHQRGILHRDLKPSNILIDAGGRPHVLDFGLAKLVASGGSAATSTEQFVGTRAYAAPEQLDGPADDVDVRSDVYALGVVLFELLTGRLPYEPGDSVDATRRAIAERDAPRPSSIARRVERDLDTITLTALARDRGARYQSTDALAADLRRYLAHEPVLARSPGGVRYLLRWLGRYPAAVSAAGAVFVAAVGLAIAASVVAGRLAQERNRAQAAQAEEAGARRAADLERAKAEAVTSFLQHMLASADPAHGSPQVTVREVLDAAAAQVDSRLADQPDVQASVRSVLATTYENLGQHEAAEAQLLASLELLGNKHGDSHPGVLETLARLSALHHAQGRHGDASEFAERALALYSRRQEARSELPDIDLTGLIAHLCGRSEYDRAVQLYRDKLVRHRAALGDADPALADDMAELAGLLVGLGRTDEALELQSEALTICRQRFGEEHPRVGAALHALAKTHLFRDELDAALPLFRRALVLQQRFLPAQHPDAIQSRYDLANALFAARALDEALEHYEQVLGAVCISHGEQHRDAGVALYRVGRVLFELARYPEAAERFERAMKIFEARLPAGHPRIGQAQRELGRSLTEIGQFATAERLLLAAHESARAGSDAQKVVAGLVRLYELSARSDEAACWGATLPPP